MHNNNAYRNHLENEVLDADPVKLVTLIYRGTLDAVAAARLSLHNGDIEGRSRQISKATLLLNELALGLDHSKGGEISRSLAQLYDYMARRLNEANFHQIEDPLIEVQRLLTTLFDAWQQTADLAAPAPPLYAPTTQEYRPISCSA